MTCNSRNIFSMLFEAFDEEGISYCILRNYEGFPEHNIGTDIDVLIDRHDFKQVERIIKKFVIENNFKLLPLIKRSYVHSYRLFKINNSNLLKIVLDFHPDEQAFGFIYLTSEELLSRRRRFKSFYVPDPIDEAIISWFSSYLAGGFIKKKYEGKIIETFKKERVEFIKRLSKLVGREISLELARLIEQEDLNSTLQMRKRVFKHIIINSFKKYFWRQIRSSFNFLCSELRLMLKPPGFVIAFIGPDGSGKSTIAAKVIDGINDVIHSDRKLMLHWRPGLFPRLRYIVTPWKWSQKLTTPITNPHASKPSGILLSLFRLLYYISDFIFGFYIKIYPLLRKNTYVIFDRYYYDTIVDPLRSRINLPFSVIKFFTPLIPKPDVTVYLDSAPETLYSRKPELRFTEFRRQVNLYRKLVPFLPNSIIVSNEKPLEEAAHEVVNQVLEKIAEKTQHELLLYTIITKYLINSTIVHSYLALPSSKKCRWIIPSNPKLAEKSWELYHPYNFRGKLYKKTMCFLSRKGLLAKFKPFRINSGLGKENQELKEILYMVFKRRDVVLSFSISTSRAYRKITGMVLSPSGQILGYVKIGATSFAIERIKHEAKILNELANTLRTSNVFIPRCIFEGELGNTYMMIQTPPPFIGKAAPPDFNELYAKVLNNLTEITKIKKKFQSSEFVKNLKQKINIYFLPYRNTLKSGLLLLENCLGDKEIYFSISHGDFVPWNMLWKDDQVFLYDWESSCSEAPVGIDFMHFLFQTGFLLKKLRGEKLLHFILNHDGFRYLNISNISRTELLLSYLLHMGVQEDKETILSKSAVERRNLIELLIDGKEKGIAL